MKFQLLFSYHYVTMSSVFSICVDNGAGLQKKPPGTSVLEEDAEDEEEFHLSVRVCKLIHPASCMVFFLHFEQICLFFS